MNLMAGAPFSAPTVADYDVACSASSIGGGRSEVLNWRCNVPSWDHISGSRRIRIPSHGAIRFRLWNREQRLSRDSQSIGQDLSTSEICSFCCHGNQGEKGAWKVRAHHLGFESRDGAAGSKIRGGALLSVVTREQLVEFEVRRQGAAGRRRKGYRSFRLYASRDPYEVLGVPSTATDKEIKQAYRRLALKLHPDVNKEPDAQQQFLRVKNAYQTLTDETSRAKYDSSKRGSPSWDPFSWETERQSARESPKEADEFYGIGDFFKDLAVSIEDFFRDLQADSRRQASKPKSLWEELADIGEEFVEFLEKELNINDTAAKEEKASDYEALNEKKRADARDAKKNFDCAAQSGPRDPEADKAKVETEIAEIEDMLAQLKKELGI